MVIKIPVRGENQMVLEVIINLQDSLDKFTRTERSEVILRPASYWASSITWTLLGGTFFVQIEPWLLQLIVALFILWSVFGKIPAIGATHVVFGGMFSGFFTMFFGASGTLVAGMVKTMKLEPVKHTATHSALMTIQHLIKVIIFGFVGFVYAEYFLLIVAMIVSGFVGTLIGKKILVNFGKKYFKLVLNIILTLIAANLIWNAIKMSGYLADI